MRTRVAVKIGLNGRAPSSLRSSGCLKRAIARCVVLVVVCGSVGLPTSAEGRQTWGTEASTSSAGGQETGGHEQTDGIVLQWLSEPLRRDIPAQVHISQARLAFEQRLTVTVQVEVPAKELQAASVRRDLYLAVEANDGKRWVPGGSYTHYELKDRVDKRNVIEFTCTPYISPGHWMIGVVLYDDVLKQRTVLKTELDVAPIKHDPLPRLESSGPGIFGEGVRVRNGQEADNSPALADYRRRTMDAQDGLAPGRHGGPGRGPAREPGRNRFPDTAAQPHPDAPDEEMDDTPREIAVAPARPLEMDVLVDFTPSVQYSGSNSMLRRTEATFWAVTHVLTELRSPNLCMRVTGVDVLGQHVLFEHMDGANMDWDAVAEALSKLDANTVDVQSLENRTKAAAFFREQVENLLATKDTGCDAKAEHVFVVAASGILFPSGTASKPIEGSPTRLFYLRANLLWNDQWDAMEKIVKPLKPRTLNINDPMQFRKALAKMVSDLEGKPAQ